jgi:hypothetical protein
MRSNFGCLDLGVNRAQRRMNIARPKGDLRSKPLSVMGLHDLMAEFLRRSNFGCLDLGILSG